MDETIKLIREAHAGDKAARDRLVLENVGLVWSIVRRFGNRRYEMEDLFQIGNIGLLKAIDKFDFKYDVKFSTYAVPMITGEIKRFLRDDGMIKVSRTIKELGIRVRNVRESMVYELGREPAVEEIAERLGVTREEVAASIEAGSEVESLHKVVNKNEDNNLCLMDRIEDGDNRQEEMVNRMVLKDLLMQLTEQDREIIFRRYFDDQTQNRIAQDLCISQVQVSRLEKRILKQMRERIRE